MLLFGVVMLSFGTILPEIVAKYQADEIATGVLLSILPVGVLVGSLAFGPIADTYGYKWLLIACILIVIIGIEGIAFAKSWRWLEISAFLIGTGGGAATTTAPSTLLIPVFIFFGFGRVYRWPHHPRTTVIVGTISLRRFFVMIVFGLGR